MQKYLNKINDINPTLLFWGQAALFALLWCAPRLWLFHDNIMMHDDYFMAAYDNVYDVFFIKEYRPLGGVYPTLCKWLIPGFYASNIAIAFNAVLIGTICSLLFGIFLSLGGGGLFSLLITLLFAWHPIINDISAWNVQGFELVACILSLYGFRIAWRANIRSFFYSVILITCSLATYQLMIPIPMCLSIMFFLHYGVVENEWKWKAFFSVVGSLITSTILYLIHVFFVSPMIFGASGNISMNSPFYLLTKLNGVLMQTINLYLNLFYSIFSFYIGAPRALSLWKYAPLTIAGIGALTIMLALWKKRIRIWNAPALMLVWVALPFVAILPLWLINFYTEWRISVIVLIAQLSVVASIAGLLARNIQMNRISGQNYSPNFVLKWGMFSVIVIVATLTLPVTSADSKMRLDDYRHDLAIIDSIKQFRDSSNASALYRVAYIEDERKVLSLNGSESVLMKANYIINTYSTFSYGKIWAEAMFRWYGIQSIPLDEAAAIALSSNNEIVDVRASRHTSLPYVIHYPSQNISIVHGSPQWYTWDKVLKK